MVAKNVPTSFTPWDEYQLALHSNEIDDDSTPFVFMLTLSNISRCMQHLATLYETFGLYDEK